MKYDKLDALMIAIDFLQHKMDIERHKFSTLYPNFDSVKYEVRSKLKEEFPKWPEMREFLGLASENDKFLKRMNKMEEGEILTQKLEALRLAQGIYGDELGIAQNKYHCQLEENIHAEYPVFDLSRLFEIYKNILSNVNFTL